MKIVCRDVGKRFGDKIIYEKASFEAEEGNIYGLLGRNGVGKTTLLNCICGDEQIDCGALELSDEKGVYEITPENVGYVLATPMLPEFMTGYEFINFFIDISELKEVQSADYYLDLVNIENEDRHKLIKDYSLGMKNKLQLLMPIISQPKIILLDEPLTSFDVVVAEEMKALLAALKKDKIIIFSTHILQLAEELCDKLILVNNHKLEMIDGEALQGSDGRKNIVNRLLE